MVANEVRHLATGAKVAAQKTEKIVRESIMLAGQGSRLSGEATARLGEIHGSVDRLIGLVKNIAQAMVEQASGLKEVRATLARAEEVIGTNSEAAAQASTASEELAKQAHDLAPLFEIRTEPARREGLVRHEQRGRILNVFNRGVRQRARTAAATATGELRTVVLEALVRALDRKRVSRPTDAVPARATGSRVSVRSA